MTASLATFSVGTQGPTGELAELVPALCAVHNACSATERTHDDFHHTPALLAANLTSNQFNDIVVVVGRDDSDTDPDADRLVGYAVVALGKDEASDRAGIEVVVHPRRRNRGVGTALHDEAIRIAERAGRSLATGAFSAPLADPGDAGAIRSRTDPIVAGRSAASDFLLRRGWTVGQIERCSTLTIPDPIPPGRVAPGYAMETWAGRADRERAGALAALFSQFTQDVPDGDLDVPTQQWDADRYLAMEASDAARAMPCTALVRDEAGRAVGYTQLWRVPDRRHATQGVTQVLAEHRGHGLGEALKLACLRQGRDAWPEVERVHTWNAGENDHMWRINERLGFVPHAAEVAVQRRLDADVNSRRGPGRTD